MNYKYFDIQVNGYAGIDFNSHSLTEDELLFVTHKLIEDNVEGIFATIITDDFESMLKKIKNLASLIAENDFVKSIIKGIHIEGPFLNPENGFHGAHPKEFIIPPNLEKVKELVEAGEGLIKIFTLAPEYDNNYESIKYLSDENIVVSAGHSDASREQLLGAIDAGLKMFTHLGNGSPKFMDRHDNIINRVLSLSDKLYICFIADGIHIPSFALKNYIKVTGFDKCIIVTDCMAAASAPPGRYSVSHINVEVGEDKIVREVGKTNLAGSAITMRESEKLLRKSLEISGSDLKKILNNNAKSVIRM